jgi:hypothetical protein
MFTWDRGLKVSIASYEKSIEGTAMADVINLRLARKARQRKQAEQEAAANRSRFGRTKVAKERQAKEAERLEKVLDGTKLDE